MIIYLKCIIVRNRLVVPFDCATDDQRQLGQIFMIFDLTSAFGPQGSLILESKAGMPINLLVTNDVPYQDITQAGQYNLYVVLEELFPVNRDH